METAGDQHGIKRESRKSCKGVPGVCHITPRENLRLIRKNTLSAFMRHLSTWEVSSMSSARQGLLDRIRHQSRGIALALLIGCLPVINGCYGKFPLTHWVYKYNGEISENRFVKSILFWVFIILPVYSLAMLGDAVIFNLIEFWGGKTLDIASETLDDGTRVVLAPSADQRQATLTITSPNGKQHIVRFVKISDTVFDVMDHNDHVTGHVVRQYDGAILLQDANKRTVCVLQPAEVVHAMTRIHTPIGTDLLFQH
jgi:hypothetical protein